MTESQNADTKRETLLDRLDDPAGVLECASAVTEWCDAEKLDLDPCLILGLTRLVIETRRNGEQPHRTSGPVCPAPPG